MADLVKTLVKETRVPQDDAYDREPYVDWLVFSSREEALEYIKDPACPQAGFGLPWKTVQHEILQASLTLIDTIVASPVVVKDIAHPWFEPARVNIELKGRWSDPPVVYWTHGTEVYRNPDNSFVVLQPPPDDYPENELVCDQGVVLACINGIGEVRWWVGALSFNYPENQEAVAHFGLTWTNR